LKKFWAGGAMYCSIHPAAAQQRGVRRIDDGRYFQRGYIRLKRSQDRCH
jgi:hypothetical protein